MLSTHVSKTRASVLTSDASNAEEMTVSRFTADNIDALIDAAYDYAFPLWEVARTRYADANDTDPARRLGTNTVRHDRQLCDAHSRWITAPNNDTLYSQAWLDLSGGPVRIEVGAQPAGRYWSVALMDAFTNVFAILGQRLDGVGPVSVTLVGPGDGSHGTDGRVIRAPGHDVWLFARWLVDGPADLPNARAMQDRLAISAGLVEAPPGLAPTDGLDPAVFLAVVNERLARNPAPPADAALLARLARVGVRAGSTRVWNELDASARDAWRERIGAAHDAVRRSVVTLSSQVQGWSVRGPELGNFGTHYALRAAVALGGLAALVPDEAVYARRFADERGEQLDGRNRYRLRVSPEGLPTDSFWSLTMYAPADGRFFFVDNPIERYSIGNRTPGLRYENDGALEIRLQHEPPGDPAGLANWLPAPEGPFVLSLRAYLPRPALRDWRAPLPTIARN